LRLRRRRGGDARRVLDRQPGVGPSLGCPRPTVPVPGERPELFRFYGPDGPLLQRPQPVPPADACGRRPRWPPCHRSGDLVGIPASAAPRAIHGPPPFLLARGVPRRDRLLVRLRGPARRCLPPPVRCVHLFRLPPALAGFWIVNFGNPNTLALFLVFSALAQFPGYAASFLLVDRWGRKRTLALFLILGGLSGYVFATARDFWTLVVGLFFVS